LTMPVIKSILVVVKLQPASVIERELSAFLPWSSSSLPPRSSPYRSRRSGPRRECESPCSPGPTNEQEAQHCRYWTH
jgi:hypothetical protein